MGTDAYSLLQSLGDYLKTDIEVSRGMIERKLTAQYGSKSVQREGHKIRVTVTNTAPAESRWPAIVFTGIGLGVKYGKHRDENFWGNPGTRRYENHLKIDLTNAPQGGTSPFPRIGGLRVDNNTFPDITSDERKHGYYLFPSQSITYELSLSLKECPEINDLHLWVEGTVSRRHLFHYIKDLPMLQP